MAETESSPGHVGSLAFGQSLRVLLAAASSLVQTRLELFVTELDEERERVRQTLLLTLLVFFGLGFGFILLNIFAVALFWQRGWIVAVGALATLYLGVGIIAGAMLRRKISARNTLFPATLAEFGKDCERLRASVGE
jgi:uncharacterized membrane protein YqjE